MIKYGELHHALARYTCEDIHENIPVDFYRRVIKACFRANNKGPNWDVNQAAAILLYLAFNEGFIQPNQLTSGGLKTLDWAENFLEQISTDADKDVVRALVSV